MLPTNKGKFQPIMPFYCNVNFKNISSKSEKKRRGGREGKREEGMWKIIVFLGLYPQFVDS